MSGEQTGLKHSMPKRCVRASRKVDCLNEGAKMIVLHNSLKIIGEV